MIHIFKTLTEEQKSIGRFILKASIIFILWKIIYLQFAEPKRTLDKPLTNITATATKGVLGLIHKNSKVNVVESYYPERMAYKENIFIDEKKIIGIADPCNALELIVLHLAFFGCYPIESKRKAAKYLFFGALLIFAINIFRCVVIAELNWNLHLGLSDFAHHYLFKIIIYIIVFLLWVQYVKKSSNQPKAV